MAFTKCWLAYPEIKGCRCDAISLHTELTGETVDRAKAELAEGLKGLYGAALTEGDDITLALDTTLDPEGYRLKAALHSFAGFHQPPQLACCQQRESCSQDANQ